MGIMLASLVAAIPGVLLTYFVVMAFWHHAESMSGMLLGLSAITLIVSAAAILLPIGIILFTPKPAASQPSDAAVAAAGSDDAVMAAESGADFEAGPATMEGIAVADSSETLDGIAFSDSEIEAAADEEFDLGDIESDAEEPYAETTEEDFDFDFDDEK